MFNKILSNDKKEGSFEKDFYEFMCERQENNRAISIQSNKRYDKLLKQIIEFQKKISELLPAENREIMIELSALEDEAASIDMDLSYAQGFRDGMRMQLLAISPGA